MGCPEVEKAVFIETNLGTRLAVPLSPEITAKEFKRELELTHLSCFPEYGRIRVTALMVKQKSCCYHLSESLPLKYAFMGSNSWFLQTDVHPNQVQPSIEHNPTQVDNHVNSADHNVVTDSVVCFLKRKKAKKIKNVKRKRKTGSSVQQRPLTSRAEVNCSNKLEKAEQSLSETFSESASVSGIINKYFPDYDEVASTPPPVFPLSTIWNRDDEQLKSDVFESKDSTIQLKKPQVGKRLLLASDSLGLSPSKQGSALALSRYTSNAKSLVLKEF